MNIIIIPSNDPSQPPLELPNLHHNGARFQQLGKAHLGAHSLGGWFQGVVSPSGTTSFVWPNGFNFVKSQRHISKGVCDTNPPKLLPWRFPSWRDTNPPHREVSGVRQDDIPLPPNFCQPGFFPLAIFLKEVGRILPSILRLGSYQKGRTWSFDKRTKSKSRVTDGNGQNIHNHGHTFNQWFDISTPSWPYPWYHPRRHANFPGVQQMGETWSNKSNTLVSHRYALLLLYLYNLPDFFHHLSIYMYQSISLVTLVALKHFPIFHLLSFGPMKFYE